MLLDVPCGVRLSQAGGCRERRGLTIRVPLSADSQGPGLMYRKIPLEGRNLAMASPMK